MQKLAFALDIRQGESMSSRDKRAKLNIVTSLASQLVAVICGLIVPKVMLDGFGSEAYGAVASITQFLSYIALLEGGIGGVARAVLYKPLAEGNTYRVGVIVGEVKRFFKLVGIVFVVYALIIACTFKYFSGVEALDWLTTFALVISIGISVFAQYFIGLSYQVLLIADQRAYVTLISTIVTTAVNAVLTVILVKAGCGIVVVRLVSSIVFLARPIVMMVYAKKRYGLKKVPKKDEKLLSQKWEGLGQHIAYFLHSNTDIALLTLISDLKNVSVYAVYNMVVVNIQSVCYSFVSGMEAVFGDMLAREEHSELKRTYGMYEAMVSIASVVLFSVTAVMIIPFVRLYTANLTDANYIEPLFAVILTAASLLYCLRMPAHSLIIAAGHFKQTRIAAYGETVINVLLSVILVFKFGIVGVAIGTLVATLFRFVYYAVYLGKNILNKNVFSFAVRQLINAATFSALVSGGYFAVSQLEIGSYIYWCLISVAVTVAALAVTGAVNGLCYPKDFKQMLIFLFNKRK